MVTKCQQEGVPLRQAVVRNHYRCNQRARGGHRGALGPRKVYIPCGCGRREVWNDFRLQRMRRDLDGWPGEVSLYSVQGESRHRCTHDARLARRVHVAEGRKRPRIQMTSEMQLDPGNAGE